MTIDVSRVGCGCNAALYFVAMPQPSSRGARYCDIQAHAPSAFCIALFRLNDTQSAAHELTV